MHVGLLVYPNAPPVLYLRRHKPIDNHGDHAANLRPTGFGRPAPHNSVRNALARYVLRADDCDCELEAPVLMQGTSLRPADSFSRCTN